MSDRDNFPRDSRRRLRPNKRARHRVWLNKSHFLLSDQETLIPWFLFSCFCNSKPTVLVAVQDFHHTGSTHEAGPHVSNEDLLHLHVLRFDLCLKLWPS